MLGRSFTWIRILLCVAVAIAGTAWVRDAIGTCDACAVGGSPSLALVGACAYALLFAIALVRGPSRAIFLGIGGAAAVHAALVAHMIRTDALCPLCLLAAANAAALLLLGFVHDLRAMFRAAIVVPPIAIAVTIIAHLSIMSPPSPIPTTSSPSDALRITIVEKPGCPYCREWRTDVIPRLRREFGDRIAFDFRDAASVSGVNLVPTVFIEGMTKPIVGVPSHDEIHTTIAAAIERKTRSPAVSPVLPRVSTPFPDLLIWTGVGAMMFVIFRLRSLRFRIRLPPLRYPVAGTLALLYGALVASQLGGCGGGGGGSGGGGGGAGDAPAADVVTPTSSEPAPLFVENGIEESIRAEERTKVIIFLRKPVGEAPFTSKVAGGNTTVLALEKQSYVQEQRRKVESAQDDILALLNENDFVVTQRFPLTYGVAGYLTASGLEKLKAAGAVESIIRDKVLSTTLDGSVPLIRADDVWALTFSGASIDGTGQTVCVIDSGIDYTHPSLGGGFGPGFKVVGGYDYYNNDADPMDAQSHGTHVAGIVAGTDATYRGVAPGARLVALKACNDDLPTASCSSSAIISSIDWCMTNAAAYNITVITMSIGGGQYAAYCEGGLYPISAKITQARAMGIISTVASGNDSSSTGISYPSCATDALSVGASTKTDVIAAYANTSSILDILAPGSSIQSSILGGAFGFKSGTSMATPHAAGSAALLQAYKQTVESATLTPAQIETALKSTGVSLNDPDNGLNFPRIDVYEAYRTVDDGAPAIGYIPPTPANGLITATTSATIKVSSTEAISGVTIDWNGVQENMTGSGTTWEITKSGLADGNYAYTVRGNDIAGNTGTSAMRVLTISQGADVIAPGLTFVSPTPANGALAPATVAIAITANEFLNSAILEWDGVNENMSGATTSWAVIKNGVPEGVHTYRVSGDDLAGNGGITGFRTVTVDATLPTVAFDVPTPANGALLMPPQTINVTAADANLNSIEIYVNGTLEKTCAVSPCSHTLNSGGAYSYYGKAIDVAGNSAVTATRTLTLDSAAPTIAYVAPTPANGAIQGTTGVTVAINGNESLGAARLTWNGVDENMAGAGIAWSVAKAGLADGTHTYTASGQDLAGNWGNGATRTVVVDTTDPVVAYGPGTPANGLQTNQPQTITVTATDLHFDRIDITVNGSILKTCATSPCSLLLNTTNTYTFFGTATDSVGNSAATATRTILIDVDPPIITFTTPPTPANATCIVSNSVDITMTSNEPIVGGATLQWNGVGEAMAGGGTNWTKTKSGLTVPGIYTFRVYGNDAVGNQGWSELRMFGLDYWDTDNDSILNACDPETLIAVDTTLAPGAYLFKNLRIASGATLTLTSDTTLPSFKGVTLNVMENLTVEAGAAISADGQGWAVQTGTGSGSYALWSYSANGKTWLYYWGGGGGHGGMGGHGDWSNSGGIAYDNANAPADPGSGGGVDTTISTPPGAQGGAGGGCMRIVVAGTTNVNGRVGANGQSGGYDTTTQSNAGHITYRFWAGGGGSGGAIDLDTATLTGVGSITAIGGTVANEKAGGGAGGRIRINTTTDTFTGSVNASGGAGWTTGGAGSVVRQ